MSTVYTICYPLISLTEKRGGKKFMSIRLLGEQKRIKNSMLNEFYIELSIGLINQIIGDY